MPFGPRWEIIGKHKPIPIIPVSAILSCPLSKRVQYKGKQCQGKAKKHYGQPQFKHDNIL